MVCKFLVDCIELRCSFPNFYYPFPIFCLLWVAFKIVVVCIFVVFSSPFFLLFLCCFKIVYVPEIRTDKFRKMLLQPPINGELADHGTFLSPMFHCIYLYYFSWIVYCDSTGPKESLLSVLLSLMGFDILPRKNIVNGSQKTLTPSNLNSVGFNQV